MADTATAPEFVFQPARRLGVKALVLLYGHSGSGKTYSALRLARGLVGPQGRIAMLDTEHGRGLHYADEFQFYHAQLNAPFSPARYLQALRACEDQKFDCLIVDSMSHVQEGEGGLIDMAESEGQRMKTDGYQKWAKPKAEWKRVRNRFLQSAAHVIFCARAKEPLEKVDGKKEMVRGAMVPIIPADFEYEVTVSLGIQLETRKIIPTKLPDQLAGAFPLDEWISEASGAMLAQWLNGQKIVDQALESQRALGATIAAQGMEALRAWWSGLSDKLTVQLKQDLNAVWKPIAMAHDARAGGGASPQAGGAKAAPASRNWQQEADRIAADWEGTPPDYRATALDVHKAALEEMAEAAPDIHAALMERLQ